MVLVRMFFSHLENFLHEIFLQPDVNPGTEDNGGGGDLARSFNIYFGRFKKLLSRFETTKSHQQSIIFR